MTEQPTQPSVPIHCKHRDKLLARLDKDGLHVWCRACKMYHTVSWALLQQSFQNIEQEQIHEPIRTA